MIRSLSWFLLLLAACTGAASPGTTTLVSTSTSRVVTTSTAPPVECPTPPYELEFLPTGVGSTALDAGEIEPDVWTSVPGTSATLWGRGDESVAIALIRGTLPAVDWPAEKGEVSVDGTRGVAGPHPDGTWVAGWYEEPGERCDQYTLVVYPPVAPIDVEQIIDGMNRVGG